MWTLLGAGCNGENFFVTDWKEWVVLTHWNKSVSAIIILGLEYGVLRKWKLNWILCLWLFR